MGEAKRRGTFDQRKAEGEIKRKKLAEMRRAYLRSRPKVKTGVTMTALLGMAFAMQEGK